MMRMITLRRMMERMIASMLRKMSRGVHDVDHGGVKGTVYRYKAADQEQATLAPHALREPAQSKCIWTSHKSSFMRTLAGKKRTRNTHGHVSRAILRGQLTGKRPQTKSLLNSPGRLCASLRNQNTYGHVTKAIFDLLYDTSKKKGQEPRASTSIKHRPSLLPYETLSVGTLMGKKKKVLQLMTIINNQFQAPISRYFCSCCSPSAPQL